MKEDNNTKILLALLAGAAAGIAIGYFLNSSKKEELADDLNEGASKLKDNLSETFEKGKTIFDNFKNAAEDLFKNTTSQS